MENTYHVTLIKDGRIMAEATAIFVRDEEEAIRKVMKHYGYTGKMDAKILRL